MGLLLEILSGFDRSATVMSVLTDFGDLCHFDLSKLMDDRPVMSVLADFDDFVTLCYIVTVRMGQLCSWEVIGNYYVINPECL